MQRKSTIQLGPWAPRCIQAHEKRDCHCTSSSLLKSKKTDCFANCCKHQGSRSLLITGPKTSLFCKQGFDWSPGGYVAIELEPLAVAWAMEKFHHFLYASHFILETDQKPLETILSKSINQATPRLQCILIRTFLYHVMVRYISGLTNQLADCLSRLGCQKDTIKTTQAASILDN